MDKETLSHYGWVVILVLILSVLLAFATPFGTFVADAVKSTTQGLFDVNQNALLSTGLINIKGQEFDSCPHIYETTTTGGCHIGEITTTNTCKTCGKTTSETVPAHHTFDNPSDLECNRCDFKYIAYNFKAQDYDAKMGTTTATDANVVIPETFEYDGVEYKVTSIGWQTFFGNKSLTSITLPASITKIESYAFCQCTSLKSVDLSKCTELSMIQMYAFYNCSSLESIDFSNCIKLTEISDNAFAKNSIKNLNLSNCTKLQIIDDSAFESCTSLTNVVLPDNITTIGHAAFCNCTSLKSIDLSNCTKLTNFGYNVFKNCTSLANITLHDNIKVIDRGTFLNCKSLTNITIPAGVRIIGEETFYNCTLLNSIIFEGTIEQWNAISFDADWIYNVPATQVQCSNGIVNLM